MTVHADAAKNPQHNLFPAACFSALTRRAVIVLQLALAISVLASACLAQTPAPVSMSMSMPTAARVQSPGWWPTKGDATRDSFVGTATCAKCHASKAASQQKHAMASAA